MGLYQRRDSPYWWMSLERRGQRPLQQSTRTPVDGGTQIQTRDNRKLAQAIYAAQMGDLARAKHGLPVSKPGITFAAYRAWYFATISATKKNQTRERSMLRQLGAYFDARELASLTKEDGLDWRRQRSTQVAHGTVNRELHLMKHLLGTAVPKYLDANPWARLPELDEDQLEPRLLEPAEERRLLPGLTPEERALVICALDTLQRLSTVAALRWPQDHGAYLTVLRPKGATTVFYKVPVSRRLRKALNAIRPVSSGADLVFPSFARGTPEATRKQVEVMFEARCRAVRIPFGRNVHGLTFHGLRHTGASRMLNQGVDIKTVAEIGNWKNLAVLQRYLHPIGSAHRQAVEAVGRLRAHDGQRKRP